MYLLLWEYLVALSLQNINADIFKSPTLQIFIISKPKATESPGTQFLSDMSMSSNHSHNKGRKQGKG